MRLKAKKNIVLLALIGGVCGLAAVSSLRNVTVSAEEGSAKTATAIEYDGYATGVYALEHYAGFEGTYWILDAAASTATTGTAGRRLGSGTNDGRDVTMTIVVNSSMAANTCLRLYAEFYEDAGSSAVVTVNGANITGTAEQTVSLFGYNKIKNVALPTEIPVSLVAGTNTISIDMPQGYNAWMESFQIGDITKIDADAETSIATHTANAFYNTPEVYVNSWGGAFKDVAYKAAEYDIYVEEDSEYRITLGVEAGNTNENYGQILVDGNPIHTEEYVEYALASWGTVSDNVFKTELTAGKHTITVKACNKGYDASLETQTSWCNLWVKKLSVKKIQAKELELNTTNAKFTYNPYDEVDVSGVTAKLIDQENSTETDVTANLSFDKPTLSEKKQYTVTARYTENGKTYEATYSVNVTGEMTEKTAQTIKYSGVTTGTLPLYGADRYVSFSKSDETATGGIAWINNALSSPYSNAYEIGNGGENRQADMIFSIDAEEAGKVNFSLFGKMTYNDTTAIVVTLNGTELYNGSAKAAAKDDAGATFTLDLVKGENTLTLSFGKNYIAWLKGFEVAPVPVATLTLDKTNVKTQYGYFETLDLTGLTATAAYDGTDYTLAYSNLAIDSSAFDNTVAGTYTINVSYELTEGVTATESFTVTVSGQGYEREAQSFDYTGTATSLLPLFSADSKIGLSGTADKMYWILPKDPQDLYPSAYEIGSSASDGRKLTLTLLFDSTVEGKVTLTLYGKFYAESSSNVKVSVNDDDQTVSLYGVMSTDGSGRNYATIDINVTTGENLVTIAFGTGYDGWMQAVSLGAVQADEPLTPPETSEDPGTSDTPSSGSDETDSNSTTSDKGGCGSFVEWTAIGGIVLACAVLCVKGRKEE